MEQIENGMVIGAEQEWDEMSEGDYWTMNRTSENVDEFVDCDMAVEIMRWYLGIEGGDEDRLFECYCDMKTRVRDEINVDYIESHGLEQKFNEWYENR